MPVTWQGGGGFVSPGFTPRPSLSVDGVRPPRDLDPVSPGFTPRPSLSVRVQPRVRVPCVERVAGVHAPAFVERSGGGRPRTWTPRVAGVHAPAFVERSGGGTPPGRRSCVSPGFTPRPSLSDPLLAPLPQPDRVVSPGFTPRPSLSERRWQAVGRRDAGRVSPGFTPRPSLSVGRNRLEGDSPPFQVSPGFTPRPSLSEADPDGDGRAQAVSPGFTPRPSLSEGGCGREPRGAGSCRLGSRPGLR